MSRFIVCILLIALGGSNLGAQQAIFRLIDETGEVLPGVAVKLTKSGNQKLNEITLSDADGLAKLSIAEYPAQLEISNLGQSALVRNIAEQPQGIINIELNRKYTGLSEVVVTGVGKPTKLDEAVSVYRIISAADIRAQGAVNLQDALRNQIGMSIGQDAMLGGTIKMQGLSGDNVKFLVDGLPLSGREGQNVDLSTINMANIERIEVVQGPMSIMYGADALGGVINLITKNNTNDWNLGADLFHETVGKYNLGLHGAIKKDRSNLTMGVGRNFFQGWDPNFDTVRNPLWRPKEQYFANLKYTYQLGKDASVTYGTDYMHDLMVIKEGLDNFSAYNKMVTDERITTQRWMNRLQFKWKTGTNGYWESNNSYSLYNRKRENDLTDLTTMEHKMSTVAGDNSITGFNDFSSRTTYNNKAGILNYTFGYDINMQFASGVEKISGGKQNVGDYALFLITDINLTDNLRIQPAIRTAYNTKYPAPVLPSFSVLYKPSASWRFRGSYARGFRAPTIKELYLDFKDSNHDVFGNPDLKSENGHHFQFSGAWSVAKSGNNYCNLSLTGFYNDVSNQIMLLPEGESVQGSPAPYSYVNLGKFRNLNFQLQSQSQWEQLSVVLGASFNNNIKTVSNPQFDYWEASGNFQYAFPVWKASISLFYKYTGSMPLQVSDGMGNITTGAELKDYHNLDLSVNKSFCNRSISITAGVRNLFNNKILGYVGGSTAGSGGSTGTTHGGGSSVNGLNLTTGRTAFVTLSLQLSK